MSRRIPRARFVNVSGPSASAPRFSAWRSRVVCCLVLAVAALGYIAVNSSRIVRAERAFGRGDQRLALALATQELRDRPDSDRALLVAGSVSLAMQDRENAEAFLTRVSRRQLSLWSQAQRDCGRLALEAGRASAAEEQLRQSLQAAPEDSQAHDSLIYLLTLEGRTWEARLAVAERLQAGVVTPNYLTIAATPYPSLEAGTQFADHCLQTVPGDALPRLALARKAWRDDRPGVARQELEIVLRQYPGLVEAHALLGRVLAETGASAEFIAAERQFPASADRHPEIWLARGIWSEKHGQTEAAARCYWESLLRDPNLPHANYRLSQALVSLRKGDLARPFADRAQRLTKLSLEISALPPGIAAETVRPIARQLEELGRDWEAVGWCQRLLMETGQRPAWALSIQRRLYRRLWTSQRLTAPERDPARQSDFSQFPLPILHEPGDVQPTAPQESHSRIAFAEEAERSGVRFIYRTGAPAGDQESMLAMNGGGIAAFDYDVDLRPDLYFTQGGSLPPAAFDSRHSDQLFRNRGGDGDAFENVTAPAGLHDLGYGQGVTSGDFDVDGFPDLYVGNIGRNQLYRNNGDGTFSDVTAVARTHAGGWTSSCVLADFNQDGLPDLYVVTYLGGQTPYAVCRKQAQPRCSPLAYPAEPDRFYLNLGDGRFQDLSETGGLQAPEGRGLGVVAADFDGSRRLSLFVANDMTSNFYFLNQTTARESPQFTEQALLFGLGYDDLGQAKASMGVAVGDCNRDDRLDLYVTNFYRQSNDLYLQREDGTFRDRSREARLFEPSFLQLGWGTQFLDGDLDGQLDLIVTNGHVHDPLDPGIPYAMPPQFFRNLGNGTFAEIDRQKLGPFFAERWLGRSLVTLDWNRDGRDDACISHLDQPAALLTNRTAPSAHCLVLRLVAVESARDAIGTIVRVTAGGESWMRQLTAGDGFQACNERRLVFGLGERDTVDSVVVEWPSGTREEFSALPPDREWLLIEHRPPVEIAVSAER